MTEDVQRGVLRGGPQDGREIAVAGAATTVQAQFMCPPPLPPYSPRPRWWRHPVQWLRWRPPPPPPPPRVLDLLYRAAGADASGRKVFELASPWRPYRRQADVAGHRSLLAALVAARAAVHPLIGQDPHTRVVMGPGWYARLRAEAGFGPPPPEEWRLPGHMVLGLPVLVAPGAGPPRVENTRYPDDWP